MNEKELSVEFQKRALKAIESSTMLIEIGDYNASVSRSYYAMYYMIESLFILKGMSSKTHSGKIILFRKEFVITGIFSNDLANCLSNNFNDRMLSDYEGTETITNEIAINDLDNAKHFINEITEYFFKNNLL